LCELVKNALAISPETIPTLSRVLRIDCCLDASELASLVDIAIDPKMKVMRNDEREKGSGLILEYGHTIGHALELASPGLLSHGEAVGVGMLCAAEISERAYSLSEAGLETHAMLLSQIGVTRAIAESVPIDTVLRLLRYDNKRGYLRARHDQLPMILLDGIGKQRWSTGSPLTPVPFTEVERTISGIGTTTGEPIRLAS
jgi:3-dehydroquinate synthase/2-deoxy-scyllo-inosose synthase